MGRGTVDRHRHRLLALHDVMKRDGSEVTIANRFLIEAEKPS
jgi:hypothetical protein